jgi:hypothetical protein
MNRPLSILLALALPLAAAAADTPPPTPTPAAAAAPAAATAAAAAEATDLQPAVATSTAAAVSTVRGAANARDRVELDNTQITGNRELPRVMYVVPWKKPDLGELGGKPAKSLLDELLQPVDRDVFQRQNRYFDALQPDAAKPLSGTTPAPHSGDEK